MILAFLALAGCGSDPEVVLIGIDGASWKVIGPMIEAGELRTLAALREQGASMPEFETMGTTTSPIVWTTVATGRTPREHGIRSFVTKLPHGGRIPVSSNARRVPALWNVLTQYERRVGVIGWWATWPAEAVNGYVVTDHANPAAADWMIHNGVQALWNLDPRKLTAQNRDTYPPALAGQLEPFWFDPDGFPYAEAAATGGLTPEQLHVLRGTPWHERSTYGWFKSFYAVDVPLARVARHLRTEQPVDLQMVYLRGPDPMQHYSWDLVEPQAFAERREHFERDRGMVEAVYRYVDRALGELLADVDADTHVIVCSDHGAEPARGVSPLAREARTGTHESTARGVLFLRGPGVRADHQIEDADPYDIAPTVLWLLGLPISDEIAGRPILEAFEDGFVDAHPIRRVAAYEPRPAPTEEQGSPVDAALLERLRALGYIE
ncbi:MAG: alkaline phosphatase family protein [Thermoanaerobaculia bacterium]